MSFLYSEAVLLLDFIQLFLFTVLNRNADSEETLVLFKTASFLLLQISINCILCTLSTSCCKPKKEAKREARGSRNSWLPNSGFAVKRKLVFVPLSFRVCGVWPDSAHQQRPWLPPKLRHPANGPPSPRPAARWGFGQRVGPSARAAIPLHVPCVWSSAGGRGGHHGADLQQMHTRHAVQKPAEQPGERRQAVLLHVVSVRHAVPQPSRPPHEDSQRREALQVPTVQLRLRPLR